MKSKTLLFVMATLLFRGVAFAQLNESDTLKFQMRASVSGSWQKGNVELLIVRSKFDFVANGNKDIVFKSQNNSLYQQFGNFKADNDINSRNYLYFKPKQKIYPFAMFFVQTNFRRKIDYRFFGGIGVTYQAIRTTNSTIKFSASVVNEKTQFLTNRFNQVYYNSNNEITLWRGTAYVSGIHKIAENKFRILYNAYWQPAFSVVPNNRVQVDAGIEMTIWKGLSLNAQYIFNYEQVVVEKINQIDRILTFGLNYQIKKQTRK
jgi:Protein of unknown function, DUF481